METERQIRRPAPVPQLMEAIRERMPNPVRFGLYLVLASTPLLAISGEVFGVVSLRAVSTLFLFPLLGVLAVLVIFKPAGIDRTALAGFAWGIVACAGYDLFRLPNVYVFHLWGDFFGRIGGWGNRHALEVSRWLSMAVPRRRSGHRSSRLPPGRRHRSVLLAQAACRRVHRRLRRLSRMGRTGAYRRTRSRRASVVPAQRDHAGIEPGRAPDLRGDPGLRAVGITEPCRARPFTRGHLGWNVPSARTG